jgi:hypothetical protein
MTARSFRAAYTDALWNPNALRPTERLIALAYAKYAGAKGADEDVSWVPWATLADMTGIRSRSTLNLATRALEDAGWIEQIEAAKQHRAPRYRLSIPPNPGVRFSYSCEDTA